MNMLSDVRKNEKGHSFLELVAVCVVIGILVTIIIAGFDTVHRNRQNQERQTDINTIYQQLESYYVVHSLYPTLAELNTQTWDTSNLPSLNRESLRDPVNSSYLLVGQPQKNTYSYQVTAGDGGSCNNLAVLCIHYTLTSELVGTAQHTYVRSSLN